MIRMVLTGLCLLMSMASASTAQEGTGPAVVSRAGWGARHPKKGLEAMRYSGDLETLLTWIVVHHTGYMPSGPREVQDEHILPKGTGPGKHPFGRNWYDMGYHFMIGRKGVIYAGRGLEFIGSHVGVTGGSDDIRLNPNFGTIGIAVFGHFVTDGPQRDQVKALYRLLDELSQRYTIPPGQVIGHLETAKMLKTRGLPGTPTETVCPGEHLQVAVEKWRAHRRATSP